MSLPVLPRCIEHKIFWHRRRADAAEIIQAAYRSWKRRLDRIVNALIGELERLGRARVPQLEASVYVHVTDTDTHVEVQTTDGSNENASSEESGWFGLAEAAAWWRPHKTSPSPYCLMVGLVTAERNEVLCTVWRSCASTGMVVGAHKRYRRRRLRNGAVALAPLTDETPTIESVRHS